MELYFYLFFDKNNRDIVILVNLVDSMIEINNKLNSEKNPDVVTILRWQVEIIDEKIDRLIYGLYQLTEEEINIIEDRE